MQIDFDVATGDDHPSQKDQVSPPPDSAHACPASPGPYPVGRPPRRDSVGTYTTTTIERGSPWLA